MGWVKPRYLLCCCPLYRLSCPDLHVYYVDYMELISRNLCILYFFCSWACQSLICKKCSGYIVLPAAGLGTTQFGCLYRTYAICKTQQIFSRLLKQFERKLKLWMRTGSNIGNRIIPDLTLVTDQLGAQLFYFIIRLLQSSMCFEQRRAHHQEVKFY